MIRRNIITLAIGAIAALAFTGATRASDFPAGSPKFLTTQAAALKASKDSGKPLILVFSASWCGPCQLNKNQVYPSKEVQPYHDKFVWAYLDADDEANIPAMEKAGVSGIPHIEIVDKHGKRIGQSIGSTSPAEFANTLTNALKAAGK